jgi:hypothetical protein
VGFRIVGIDGTLGIGLVGSGEVDREGASGGLFEGMGREWVLSVFGFREDGDDGGGSFFVMGFMVEFRFFIFEFVGLEFM